MATNDATAGRPVFATRTVGEATTHRVVHCGALGRTLSLDECSACSSFLATDTDALGRARVRCRAEAMSLPPDPGADADEVAVTSIIHRKTTSVAPETDLETAAALLLEREVGALVVVDAQQHAIGILTPAELARDRALTRAEGPAAGDGEWPEDPTLRVIAPEVLRVHDVMVPLPTSVPDYASVARASAIMAEEGLVYLPVVGHDGRLVGVVTALDVLGWVAERARFLAAR